VLVITGVINRDVCNARKLLIQNTATLNHEYVLRRQ